MKFQKIILPVAAAGLLLTSCDDLKMDWGLPDGHYPVTSADIPLAVKEVIANYDDIKTYAAQYTPNLIVGLGMGADNYISNTEYAGGPKYQELTNANFQMVTPGNAMKMDACVANNGALTLTTVDKMIDAMQSTNADLRLYGHNFIWHTQQNQNYLKGLISPDVEIISTGGIKNLVSNSGFEEGNTNGWGAWSSAGCKETIAKKGVDGALAQEGSYSMKLTNPEAGNNWSAQAYYKLPTNWCTPGKTYVYHCYVYSVEGNDDFQLQLQNRTSYSGGCYNSMNIPAGQWKLFEAEFTMPDDAVEKGYDYVVIDFGKVAGTTYIDDFEFGEKVVGPTNYCNNGSFEDGLTNWGTTNKGDGMETESLADTPDGSYVFKAKASASSSNYWDCQLTSPSMPTFPGEKIELSFYIKSDVDGKARVSFSSDLSNQWPWMNWTGKQDSWTEAFTTSSSWQQIDVILQNFSTDFVDGKTTWTFNIDLGKVPGVTYYIDNVQVIKVSEKQAAKRRGVKMKETKMVYTAKTAEQKRDSLLSAMDKWISGMSNHLKEKGVTPYGYDVVNEAIADGYNTPRGLNGVFGGSYTKNDATYYDAEPVESQSEINLNWGDGHFYWGYYIGDDYAAQAFVKARKYLPAETKLFINDYNLETSPNKRKAFIAFAKDIDSKAKALGYTGDAIVDGLGTQCHLTLDVSSDDSFDEQIEAFMAQVDASLTDLAATGKLVRITELDISLGTATPSSKQLEAQYVAYKRVFDSYKKLVPESQQSGITIWTLSDNADEHTYWLPNESPNIYDKDGLRKWAYKGVCDGIAGEDLGLKFNGEDYKAWYQKNNTGSWSE